MDRIQNSPTVRRIIGPTILLASGNYFDFLAPEQSAFGIEDIAHGLSMICRFSGQCSRFYSVAQHSVLASLHVDPEHAYAALMHDAAEAFLGDVSKPLKDMLPDYRALESRIEAVVFERFGVPHPLAPEIKDIDIWMLATEQHQLMPDREGRSYAGGKEPLEITLWPMGPEEAKAAFLARYHELRLSKSSGERDGLTVSTGPYVADEHGTPITGLSWCAAQPHEKKNTSHCPACGVGPLEACRGRVPQDDQASNLPGEA